ncbi:glycosyltransferase family 2 protein [Flavobacterium nitrogenifigens]|uniref:Glycosyltransferase involved in cell wall bisynthesis n=1 Tax=Flavobacterium nitrogenifigens TaxID=1617283 RepID=A0A521EG18_9FLAO|nr:glycosyltransferase [Flavobacterium nitrogenifigens]KAF2325945.1 glycosyltransferase [Flavobacterium nitrogenifigens]SMO82110.1 Glycosyltransferase involved in cell wall bisynthesis [Flavobacterium nitrogenifigens]
MINADNKIMEPIISIIMPIFNRGNLIAETLDSIKNQTYTLWECIIIDDGSTDNTIEILKRYQKEDNRFKFFVRPNNMPKGPSSCRNFAFEKALGSYIQFFDSDDIMHQDHLNLKINAIKDSDLVVCKLKDFEKQFDEKDFLLDTVPNISYQNLFEDFVSGIFPMMMVAPMWKKKSLQPYMPIREDLHILEDYELYARALFEPKKISIINEILILYRMGLSSSTNSFYSNIDYGLESYLEAKRTVLKLTTSKPVRLCILKMTLGFFRMGLAQQKYEGCQKCIDFIKQERLLYSIKLKIQFLRIQFFYFVFKLIKRGDTRFKPLLKL